MNLFIFHRDFRLTDNTALIAQMKHKGAVTPIFMFNPKQIDPQINNYFSHPSVQFLCESLKDLSIEIKQHGGSLQLFYGDTIAILEALHHQKGIQSIAFNADYTPFALQRDREITEWAAAQGIETIIEEDYTLHPILKGKTKNPNSGSPYLVYTPFKKYCQQQLTVSAVDAFHSFRFEDTAMDGMDSIRFGMDQLASLYTHSSSILLQGGRSEGQKILRSIDRFKSYSEDRNDLNYESTRLSSYLQFGCISIREAYHTIIDHLGKENALINELYWRDFYTNIAYHFPKVLAGKSFKEKFDAIPWEQDRDCFAKWCQGKTGFPIVDAAMHELNTTGFMHNRARMIVASFLTKDLFIDWRWGERYFASKLIDFNPMQNSGGWQWAAGCGTDAQPYFRIFNPWTQSQNFDPECQYIKKWIPELRALPPKIIHNWHLFYDRYQSMVNYPKPMLHHDEARKATLAKFDLYLK